MKYLLPAILFAALYLTSEILGEEIKHVASAHPKEASEPKTKNKTILYVVIAIAVVLGLIIIGCFVSDYMQTS